MPTKVLAAFGIVVGVLLLAGLTRPEGPLVIVLLNPIFWVAAGVTGVLLFRRDRKVLAVGVVGISAAAVVGLIAMLYYSPQVTAVASPSPSASPICWRPWFNSSGEYLSVRSECRSIPAPDFCYAGFLVKIPPPTYTADYPPGTYSAEVEKADFKRRHNHPDGACPDLDANGGWPGP